nr:hypothetical protein [Candidatus Shapirobacteria bacterium]
EIIHSTGGGITSYIDKLKEDNVYDETRANKINSLLANYWNHDDSTAKVSREEFQPGDLRLIVKNFFEAIEII